MGSHIIIGGMRFLFATPGNVVDYIDIEDYIYKIIHAFGIKRIERDRWNSNSIINHLMEGVFEVSTFHKRFLIFPSHKDV
jgi:phage terminase large subunit-like protein